MRRYAQVVHRPLNPVGLLQEGTLYPIDRGLGLTQLRNESLEIIGQGTRGDEYFHVALLDPVFLHEPYEPLSREFGEFGFQAADPFNV